MSCELPLYYSDRVKHITNEKGETLSDIRRFWPLHGDISEERWEHLLGADVNDWKHMRFLSGLVRWMLRANETGDPETHFSFFERKLLITAAMIHDIQELFYGDISVRKKTKDDHEKEMVLLQDIITDLWQGDVYYLEREQALQAVDAVLLGKDPRLGTFFSLGEHLSYMRTGCIAWQKSVSKDPSITPHEREVLRALAQEVVPYHMETFFADPDNGAVDMKTFPVYASFMKIHGKTVEEICRAKASSL